jgi:hypothetical protein
MAIARGAGTEIIRSASFEYVASNTTAQPIIYGVQHHIYTVLSIVCYSVAASGGLSFYLSGYDALEGTTDQAITMFDTGSSTGANTFVWNDKFSFNGHEPTDFTGPLDSIAKQDAIADQGGPLQRLFMQKSANGDQYDVHITFIDQNNAT